VVCARCGTVFCVDLESDAFWLSRSAVLYCSKRCKKRSQPGFPKHKRELRKRPGKIRAQVAFMRRRDGDDCHLCGLPIDFGITDANDPMHCSRDHVVPRALVGDDGTTANMRLAHRHCNTKKGQELSPQ
jgi:5-methylcytosine-specific restriction endonuclease McrA